MKLGFFWLLIVLVGSQAASASRVDNAVFETAAATVKPLGTARR